MELLKKIKLKVNNLFVKMVLFFLTLLIPVAIFGVVSYTYSTRAVKRDFADMILMNLSSAAKTVDIYIQTVQETNMNFLYDEYVRQNLRPYETLSIQQKVNFKDILKIISRNQNVVNNFIDNLFVFQSDKTVCRSDGVDDFSLFFGKFYKFQKYDEDFWKKMLLEEKLISILPPSNVENYNGIVKNVIPIVTVGRINRFNTAMVISISTKTIYQTLKGNSAKAVAFPGTDFLVLDNQNNIIVCSQEKQYKKTIINVISNAFEDEDINFRELNIFNQRMFVTSEKSDMFGWKYFAITPMREFYKHGRDILIMTVVLSVTLLILGVFLAFVFSYKLYSPIKNIRDILFENGELIEIHENKKLSSNEIELIGKGINYLVENKTKYMNQLKKVSAEFLDNSFINLIKGYILENEEKFTKMYLEDIGFKSQKFKCCNILFNFKPDFYNEIQDVDRINIFDGLKKIIWAIMEESVKTYVVEFKQNLYVCIINIEDESQQEKIYQAIDYIIKCFEYDFKYCEIVVGIGKSYDGINSLWRSYSEAMSAIERKEPDKKFQVIHSENIEIKNYMNYSFNDESKIINCLKTGDINNLKYLLDEIIKCNIDKMISYKHMNLLFKELYNTGLRYVAERGLDIKNYTNEEYEIWLNCENCYDKDYNKKLNYLKTFYTGIIENTVNKNENKTGSLVSMVIKYIEENYTQDIYLEKIAEEMGVSIKYISRTFKQKTSVNLTDYISLARIKKAKELLLNTNYNIDDISKQVGIYSRATFLRLFKKFEGTSPSSFRESKDYN